MSNGSDSHLKITSADLQALMQWPDAAMTQSRWIATKRIVRNNSGGLVIQTIPPQEQMSETVSLLKTASEISGASSILSQEVNMVMTTIRNGLCVGLYLAQQYEKRSGLDVLRQQNAAKILSTAQQPEFNAKGTTHSAIALFGAASYVVHTLANYSADKTSSIKPDFSGVPELAYKTPQNALMSLLYHFTSYCSEGVHVVNNGFEMVKLAVVYFEAIMNEIHEKENSFSYHEAFTTLSYQLEGSDFIVKGFSLIRHSLSVSAEFKKVGFDEIVGNRRAKHMAKRTAMMLCCYDVERKKNPFLELGSFSATRLGFGVAGTGKSLQIAANATLMQELADKIGLRFLFYPMPSAIVSTFQGGSAERMEGWMGRFGDTDKIMYAPVDDAENNFMNRAREGVSAGVREVISVFLTRTEGASAIVRGNVVIDLMTNLPEILDPAVLSRIQARFPIDGARTRHDFYDQNFIWYRRFGKFDKGFVKMTHMDGYEFLSDQRAVGSLAELDHHVGEYKVKDQKVLEAIDVALGKFPKTDHGFYAELFHHIQQIYPKFSSRDIRNIHSAVDARIMDFDLPGEWFDDPKLFYLRQYDEKVELLKEAMRANMRGLSFDQILHQETLIYLDTLAEIVNVDFERQVTEVLKRMEVNTEATRRFSPSQK